MPVRALLAAGAICLAVVAMGMPARQTHSVTLPGPARGVERALDSLAPAATPPAGRPSHDGGRPVAVLLALAGAVLALDRLRLLPWRPGRRVRPAPAVARPRPRGPPALVAP